MFWIVSAQQRALYYHYHNFVLKQFMFISNRPKKKSWKSKEKVDYASYFHTAEAEQSGEKLFSFVSVTPKSKYRRNYLLNVITG